MKLNKTIYKILSISIPIVLIGFCILRLGNIKPYQVQKLLREGHPIRVSYENFNKKYNDEDKVYVLIKNSKKFEFDYVENLLNRISQVLKRTPGANSYSHLGNAKFINYANNTFKLEPFIKKWKAFEELSKSTQYRLLE